jgi:membrane fusion protein, multidrug efflux system
MRKSRDVLGTSLTNHDPPPLSALAPPTNSPRITTIIEENPATPSLASASATPFPSAKPIRTKPRRASILVLGVVAIVLLAASGSIAWASGRGKESTDDAVVEAHIANVGSRAQGQVVRVLVNDNARVNVGDVLVELDDRDAKVKLATTEADLLSAKANLLAVETTQLALTQKNIDATAVNHRQGVSAPQSAPPSPEQIAATAARASVSVAQARVAQTEAAALQARLNLSYTHVTAPVGGVVSRRNVEVGQTVDPSRPLMALTALSDVWVVANFKEDQIAKMREGQKVTLKVDAFPGRKLEGHVDSLSSGSGGNVVTKVGVRRIPVVVRFDNLPADVQLRPGMSTHVTVAVPHD